MEALIYEVLKSILKELQELQKLLKPKPIDIYIGEEKIDTINPREEEDRMKESTKEAIDKTIEDVSSQIRKLDISDTDYADNVRALAALISARAQIRD